MVDLVNFQSGLYSRIAPEDPVGGGLKRLLDILLSLSAIILLLPLLVLCMLALTITTGGFPFFRHARIGFRGKTFSCLKFRTMMPDASERLQQYLQENPEARMEWQKNQKLRYDPRVTMFGSILRMTSVDELPQLFNVLKGDMSIVGPRPVTEGELVKYTAWVDEYLACRPGITGLWQVSGRSKTTFEERVSFDSNYSRNWSMGLDLKIVALTLPAVFDTDSAY